jgi:hypothetical protein
LLERHIDRHLAGTRPMHEPTELLQGSLSGLTARQDRIAQIGIDVGIGEDVGENVENAHARAMLCGQRERVVECELGVVGEVYRTEDIVERRH